MQRKLILNKKDILDLISEVYECDASNARISYDRGNQFESEELTIEVVEKEVSKNK